MLHLQHKLRYFSFNLFSCHAPSTHRECIILKDFGFLIWWFLCCCFRNFWTCTWKLEGRAAFGLQGCCLKDTVVFWGKNTVQRRRLGITAMPAASQQPQLLLLLLLCFRNWHFSAHYWPSATLMAINRSGWVHSTPTQSWTSLHRGTKRKVYPTSETCASVTTQLSVLEDLSDHLLCFASNACMRAVAKYNLKWPEFDICGLHRQTGLHQICDESTK